MKKNDFLATLGIIFLCFLMIWGGIQNHKMIVFMSDFGFWGILDFCKSIVNDYGLLSFLYFPLWIFSNLLMALIFISLIGFFL